MSCTGVGIESSYCIAIEWVGAMVLKIHAISYKGQPLRSPISAVFDDCGGTLGRAIGNDLVLADDEKVVSSKHAIIKYENGSFYYLDKSLNGTWITNRNKRLHHDKIRLQDKDELQIGDYDLKLSISNRSNVDARSSPFETDIFLSPFIDKDIEMESLSPFNMDHDDDFPIPLQNNMDSVETIRGESNAPVDESFTPPNIEQPKGPVSDLPINPSIGDWFDEEGGGEAFPGQSKDNAFRVPNTENTDSGQQDGSIFGFEPNDLLESQVPQHQTPSTRPTPYQQSTSAGSKHPKPAADGDETATDLLYILFKSAGIVPPKDYPEADIPELIRTVGTAFMELVDGLMSVLRSRSELKSQLRVSMTIIKPTDNNPFKFSSTVEEAIQSLFLKHQPGFLNAVDAVREGFEDIMNHQLALNAGIQASLLNILKRFDPKMLTEKFQEGVLIQKKAKCWDEFNKRYAQIAEDSIEDFFGDDFVRAYESQIAKLRTKHEKS